ncbi:plasmid partitioning/stability family protein [Rosenbergiella collisarenosi]|uniref:plasmid partitioning/stability family protein n=1 Tax=Rosenbergiella collisarenosi TaxID=1544695 RepID=UPI001F4D5167|nr:plasmid partitioning/stability family protein [Rosenbergiella collisarenosi]
MATDKRLKVQFYLTPETREQDELIQEYLEESKERPSILAKEAIVAACALYAINPRLVSTLAASYRKGTDGQFIANLISSFSALDRPKPNEGYSFKPMTDCETAAPANHKEPAQTPASATAEIEKTVSEAVRKNFSPL